MTLGVGFGRPAAAGSVTSSAGSIISSSAASSAPQAAMPRHATPSAVRCASPVTRGFFMSPPGRSVLRNPYPALRRHQRCVAPPLKMCLRAVDLAREWGGSQFRPDAHGTDKTEVDADGELPEEARAVSRAAKSPAREACLERPSHPGAGDGCSLRAERRHPANGLGASRLQRHLGGARKRVLGHRAAHGASRARHAGRPRRARPRQRGRGTRRRGIRAVRAGDRGRG